ncbi:MAG: hypothetical protein H6609_19265 [Ignavibacteriales bacterium]|nr:hypothetical protein [Ignavibacteriales bacterium]
MKNFNPYKFDIINLDAKLDTIQDEPAKIDFLQKLKIRLENALDALKHDKKQLLYSFRNEEYEFVFIEHFPDLYHFIKADLDMNEDRKYSVDQIENLEIELFRNLKNIENKLAVKILFRQKAKPFNYPFKYHIDWNGRLDQLNELYKALIDLEFITPQITRIFFNYHFFYNGKKKLWGIPAPKIRWNTSQTLLLYLFEYLFSQKLVFTNEQYQNRFSIIASHFCKANGNLYSNKTLIRVARNYSRNENNGKPQNFEIVENLVNTL